MTRRGWAVTILATWALALGWLLHREFFGSTAARLAEAARAIPPGATFFRIGLAGAQVGFASTTIDTLGDSLRIDQALMLEIPTLGRMVRTDARSVAVVTRTLRLRTFTTRFDGDLGAFGAQGWVVRDSVLHLQLVSHGDTQAISIPWRPATVLPALLPFRLAFSGDLKPGAERRAHVFDPLLLTARDVDVMIVRDSLLVVPDSADFDSTAMAWLPVLFDTVPAVRIDIGSADGTTPTWVDAQGRVVQAANSFGFTVERSAFEVAYENFRRRDTVRAVRVSARPPAGTVVPTTILAAGIWPEQERPTLRLRLTGAPPGTFSPPTARQRLTGDTLELRRVGDLAARYQAPAPPDSAFLPWLGPEPLVQSQNPRIRAQARVIGGSDPDPARLAARLLAWVHAQVRPQKIEGVPSALRAFEMRSGGCNDQALLYVALARAAGLPARTVAGLLAAGTHFYYHTWAEVYLGDWVAVDPLLGQFPADAGHVQLLVGGLARQIELAPLTGRLSFEIL